MAVRLEVFRLVVIELRHARDGPERSSWIPLPARRDAEEFMALAPHVPVRTRTEAFPLADANRALDCLRAGRISGAAVLIGK